MLRKLNKNKGLLRKWLILNKKDILEQANIVK